MRTTTVVIFVLVLIGIIAAAYAYTRNDTEPVTEENEPATFAECAELYPVMESSPRQCATPSGLYFTEQIGTPQPMTAAIDDLITVSAPTISERVSSPLTVSGEARGGWYFEATFPVEVRNAAGTVIASHYAEATSDWMTENFVPFTAELTFPAQVAGSSGTLVLRRANASGDPVRDQELVVPITF